MAASDVAQPAATSSRARSSYWILIVIAALGGVGWLMALRAGERTRPSPRSVLHLETFVVNLANPEERSYLRVGIDLSINKPVVGPGDARPVSQIRDIILINLAQCRSEELLTGEGKEKLKQTLLQALQRQVPELGVEGVYFTEFLVQR